MHPVSNRASTALPCTHTALVHFGRWAGTGISNPRLAISILMWQSFHMCLGDHIGSTQSGMVPGPRLTTTRLTTPLRTFSSLFLWASLHKCRAEGCLLSGPLLSIGSLIIQMSNYGLSHLVIRSRVEVPDLSL